jgi:hypothetical protein
MNKKRILETKLEQVEKELAKYKTKLKDLNNYSKK